MRLRTGVYGNLRESALKVDSGRKIPCRTGESNLRRLRAGLMLYHWATCRPKWRIRLTALFFLVFFLTSLTIIMLEYEELFISYERKLFLSSIIIIIIIIILIFFFCPRRLTLTWWGRCALCCLRSLPTLCYSVLVSGYAFLAFSTVFHSRNFPDNSPFSHCSSGLISVLLVLSTIYLSMKVFFSPDIIHCGWLGLKHQLSNYLTLLRLLLLGRNKQDHDEILIYYRRKLFFFAWPIVIGRMSVVVTKMQNCEELLISYERKLLPRVVLRLRLEDC